LRDRAAAQPFAGAQPILHLLHLLHLLPADNMSEVEHMPHATLQVVDTPWGHFAGGPGTSPADIKVLDDALKRLLAS